MKNNSLIIMETIWILTGTFCSIVGIRSMISGDTGKIPIFALMALVCFIFAAFRHKQRKKG